MRRFLVRVAVGCLAGALLAGAGCTAISGLSQDYQEVDCFPQGSCDASVEGAARESSAGDSAKGDTTVSDAQPDHPSLDGGSEQDAAEAGAVTDGAVTEGGVTEGGGPDAEAGGGCTSPSLSCDAGCVADDVHNCGSCGHDCTALPHVSGPGSCGAGGACSFPLSSCAPGWTHCSGNPDQGCETDVTSTANCGGCGNACSGGTPVCSGSGASYQCTSGCGGSTPTLCGGACVDTTSNPADCKTCGNVCATSVAHAQPICVSSTCGYACNSGYSSCNGACVDEQTDPANCGGCGSTFACPSGASCSGGACHCPSGDLACGGVCAVCSTPQNATPVCSGTSCSYSCTSGYTSCGGGCWATDTDPLHCGASCGACPAPGVCKQSPAGCVSGSCQYPNQTDGTPCGTNATCQSGTCTCTSGYTSCSSGCAVLSSDGNNCGSCGHVCPTLSAPSQGTTCSSSFCQGFVGGYDITAGTNPSVSSGVIYAVKVTLTQSVEVVNIDCNVTGGGGSSVNVILGLYSDNGTSPGTLVAGGTEEMLAPPVGKVTVGISSPFGPGSYWIAMTGSFAAGSSVQLTSGTMTCVTANVGSFASLPSAFPAVTGSCGNLGFYMTATDF